MKLNIISQPKSVVVITPTIGKKELLDCTESVAKQTYKNLHHLVVVDGGEFFEDAFTNISALFENSRIQVTCNPENTGKGGFYGHRIYAAYPHLVNQDYVFFLDEDNWYDSDHVSSLVETLESKNLDWAHSLRKVYIEDKYLADDCCEAIGKWPIWFSDDQYLVDTSTYCFRREYLIQVCQHWHFGWGGDRRFFATVKNNSRFDTSGKHTLNYRLPDMNKAYGGDLKFFERGNEVIKQRYGGKYPWIDSSS